MLACELVNELSIYAGLLVIGLWTLLGFSRCFSMVRSAPTATDSSAHDSSNNQTSAPQSKVRSADAEHSAPYTPPTLDTSHTAQHESPADAPPVALHDTPPADNEHKEEDHA
jgi:hypothetical protein